MTLENIEEALRDRDLSLTVWANPGEWCVWLFCADDPELGIFPGSGAALGDALAQALAAWDQKFPESRTN